MTVRIIPRLDIKGPNLVKGVHLEGLRVLGKPEDFARRYYEHGADELIYVDVVASLYGRNSLLDMIERTSREIFIPLCVAGGLRTVDDMQKVLRAGADKVSLNTSAIARPELISEAARKFGSSTVVVSIEAKKKLDGSYEAYTDNGRETTGVDVFEWAVRVAELGAGEILLTSIDQEGTGDGFDLDLTRRISESVPIPVIACGGAGEPDHVRAVVDEGAADAVAIASMFHYEFVHQKTHDEDYSAEGNIEFLTERGRITHVRDMSLADLKASLQDAGVDCRPSRRVGGTA